MKDEPLIETRRLILRLPKAEDFEPWAKFAADEEASRYLGGPQPRPTAWRSFSCMCGSWYLQGFSMFSVVEKVTGNWVGRVGPWKPEGWPGPEIGWGITRECWGKGYATEAAAATIDWAFGRLAWDRIVHLIDTDNAASRRVATKLGSGMLGQVAMPPPSAPIVVEMWGQTRDEWQANRRRVIA